MTGSYISPYVKCPFYKRDIPGRSITCEGIIDESSVSLSFGIKSDWREYVQNLCCESFEQCWVYKMIYQKY